MDDNEYIETLMKELDNKYSVIKFNLDFRKDIADKLILAINHKPTMKPTPYKKRSKKKKEAINAVLKLLLNKNEKPNCN